jgi:predicted Fe-S protein YdhL (DUF1289 family)
MTGPIASPCRNVCRLGPDGVCDGCGRTLEEVATWMVKPSAERAAIMTRLQDWEVRPPPDPSGASPKPR